MASMVIVYYRPKLYDVFARARWHRKRPGL